MKTMNLLKVFVLSGALLLPLAAQDETPARKTDAGQVRGSRRQVRRDRKAAVKAPVGQKAPDRQAAREDRKNTRSDRKDVRDDHAPQQ